MSAPVRKGWCPSVLRPMQTGDGLLVRLRPLGGLLSLVQATAIAECAVACGNGHLDLTSRANLQIRGVREATLSRLVEGLRAAGLAGDETEAGIDIVSSPLAGIDVSELIDVRPTVGVLAERAVADPALRALPAKFGFVIDGGGQLGLAQVSADVRFSAIGADEFEVQLADRAVGRCGTDAVPDVAAGLADRFLELCAGNRRMRLVVERIGAEAFMKNAGRGPLLPLRGTRWPDEVGSDEGGSTGKISFVPGKDACGFHEQATVSRATENSARLLGLQQTHLGVAFPFGRLEASDLARLASLAAAHGANDLRLTPWRALLVTGLAPAAARSLRATLDTSRFILEPTDPRLAVVACPGAPACPSGTTSTRADAATFVPLVRRRTLDAMVLHVSGCSKGCAHAGPAPLTLVGDAGHYDLIRDGTAGSTPVARGLTPDAAIAMLSHANEGGAAA